MHGKLGVSPIRTLIAASALSLTLGLVGCSSTTGAALPGSIGGPGGAGSSTAMSNAGAQVPIGAGSPVAVVTSTDVWGSVAAAVGGRFAKVTSLVTDPAADPHSFEASAPNQLALSKATVIIRNGGGYDDFMQRMIESSHPKAAVLDAVEISGYRGVNGELNEHVWYDFRAVVKVAQQIRIALSAADPADAAEFGRNGDAFIAKVTALQQKEAALKSTSNGAAVAITEAVPLYLLQAAGLVNATPPEFSEAVEGENDAPASVVAATLALFTGKKVKALVYNEQTTGPQTEQVLAAAKANGVAIVPVTETLPPGTDYLGWMNANVDALSAALR